MDSSAVVSGALAMRSSYLASEVPNLSLPVVMSTGLATHLEAMTGLSAACPFFRRGRCFAAFILTAGSAGCSLQEQKADCSHGLFKDQC